MIPVDRVEVKIGKPHTIRVWSDNPWIAVVIIGKFGRWKIHWQTEIGSRRGAVQETLGPFLRLGAAIAVTEIEVLNDFGVTGKEQIRKAWVAARSGGFDA